MHQKSKFSRSWALSAGAVLVAALLAACNGDGSDDGAPQVSPTAPIEATPKSLALQSIGLFEGKPSGSTDVGYSEITAYDALSKRLFVVNNPTSTVSGAPAGGPPSLDVIDMSNPGKPVLLTRLDISALGGLANSVAVNQGLVAVAIEASTKTAPGTVAFYDAARITAAGPNNPIQTVTVGSQPDMIVFTPDGKRVLTANEGEPLSYDAATYDDPVGSVSIIDITRTGQPGALTVNAVERRAVFDAFDAEAANLRKAGVRLYGPSPVNANGLATAAQDLEPEYIAISDDGLTAYVTLQENNAIAELDIASGVFRHIRPLGLKDHSVAGMGLDPSDEDGGTDTNSGTALAKIGNWPVKGMYLPDALAQFSVNGQTFLITANEGDARADWPGFNEEIRVRAHCPAGLDPLAFPGATGDATDPLLKDSNLGRLRVTLSPNGGDTGKNAMGQCTKLQSYGGRSFSIWSPGAAGLSRVFDSGDQFEQKTLALPNVKFNASHDNDTLDGRSASKGPEPEAVVTARFGSKTYAFIGLERVGGVMVYDVSEPAKASFVTYFNPRSGTTGPTGPEGLSFIPAASSPNGKPLLVIGHEVSGTTQIVQIDLGY